MILTFLEDKNVGSHLNPKVKLNCRDEKIIKIFFEIRVQIVSFYDLTVICVNVRYTLRKIVYKNKNFHLQKCFKKIKNQWRNRNIYIYKLYINKFSHINK